MNDNFYKDKIAIIENEFGEVNIDSEILKSLRLPLKKLLLDVFVVKLQAIL